MRMMIPLLLCLLVALGPSAWAQDTPAQEAATKLARLKPTDAQMKEMMGLVLTQLPLILDENAQPGDLARQLVPQVARMLTPEQKRMLAEMDLEQNLTSFGSMSRAERKDMVFETLRLLSHPSKREWLDRAEELSE